MARPGDDEFEWNDFDFSDFSDFEDDFDEIEAESDSEEYDPVGGGNATSAGAGGRAELACDVCGKVYKYAGSLSKHKAKDHGTSTEAPQPGTSKAPQPGTSKTGEERGSPDNTSLTGPDKATKSKRKLRGKFGQKCNELFLTPLHDFKALQVHVLYVVLQSSLLYFLNCTFHSSPCVPGG
ncbi:Hypp6358 [Branchiostoma lanceolatum]|uniref:Hypp6358 protein n=1 Tax=Branchiostoma lanceolatum TaxID=7740 RepID=A0A8J9YTE9_BRALA|nr:Hypp6358 [Branchiostoma lanceolatum]